MKLRAIAIGLACIAFAASGPAQRVSIGIAPVYDAGGDDFGEAVVQHLTLYTYKDLARQQTVRTQSLLNPGGVYTPLDTSWLTDYIQDRPDIDLLLVPTLKPSVNADKGATLTIVVELALLDAHTGDAKGTWTVTDTIKDKNAWFKQGSTMISNAVNDRSDKYGFGISSTTDFEKQPIGKSTLHLAEEIRDTLPAHLGTFAKTVSGQPADAPAASSAPCAMHTKLTYSYKHSVSHSYTLLANGLDQTLTIQDGVSTFQAPEGPLLLQFAINDAPYKLSREPIYQLSAIHSCKNSTLVIDIGQGGDAHQHWE